MVDVTCLQNKCQGFFKVIETDVAILSEKSKPFEEKLNHIFKIEEANYSKVVQISCGEVNCVDEIEVFTDVIVYEKYQRS